LKDLGKREISYGVIDHHIVGYFILFIRSILPEVVINYFMW